MNGAGHPEAQAPAVDYSLHGLVTIRLTGAPRAALGELEYLLGPSTGHPAAEPDIRITYASSDADLGPRASLRLIGLHESAFDAGRFYLLNDHGRRAAFDFERLGEPCEFVCAPGASVFPYLLPVIGLRLLRKGYVMLHAASLVHEGTGVLVTGWQKGGKTETLLAFMAAGGQYLADEWTILSPAEGRMWGISGTLQIWDWHLRYMPQYWARLRPAERSRLRLLRLYQRVYRALPAGWRGRGPAGEWLERLSLDGGVSLVGQARSAPARLFAGQLWDGAAPIDVVFLAGVGAAVNVAPIDPADIARRMVASLAFERRGLMARYDQYRYAFPGRRNALLDSAGEREGELLGQALQGRPAYEVVHPYPVPLPKLFEVCGPLVRGAGRAPRGRVTPDVIPAASVEGNG